MAFPARGQTTPGSIVDALRENRWADADAAASGLPDPVGRKLVLYYRLLTPGVAHATEIASFMADNPGWPNQAVLSRRLQEALAVDGDDRAVLALCQARPPQSTPSLLRCADANANAGHLPSALDTARLAWVNGITDPPGELAFLKTWGRQLNFADQWRRFDRIAWADNGAVGGPAFRQIARIDSAQRPAAEARLALKRDDASALALVHALPQGTRNDPGLMLDWAKWLRRAGQDDDALALWLTAGPAAEQAALPERRAAFWDERNSLARRRLHGPDAKGAYALIAQMIPEDAAQAGDAHFLAGFVALRRLNDPVMAAGHFQALAALSGAAITQARAHYWLGRADDAQQMTSQAEYRAAAAWPTTFYGQLAARALGDDEATLAARILAIHDPMWEPAHALGFIGQELSRAAALLVEWGDPRRARGFILRLDELTPEPADHALAARLATGFGMPDLAVAIARRAGAHGTMLPDAGWPLAADPPAGVEPALALGLIRQESNFDAQAASPAGARGLMQLMPATAAAVARKISEPPSVAGLTADPGYNMRLGTVYLQGLLDRFAGAMPYAVASYNAGPTRVLDWIASNGDSQNAGQADGPGIIDWIEMIPFNETRNYVQRVIENTVIYRARLGTTAPHPPAQWQARWQAKWQE